MLAKMLEFWFILYFASPPILKPTLRPPSLFFEEMVFMFKPPVNPNEKSCACNLMLEKIIIKSTIKREKSLFFLGMCFIDKRFTISTKKATRIWSGSVIFICSL